MPIRFLIADDDEAVRKSHKYAIEAASELFKDEYVVEESGTSVDAWEKIKSAKFDLILIDNDFKDAKLIGHLPGIALLQLARKEGLNKDTPIIFCSAESFDTLKPMVDRFNGIYLPKASYDLESAAQLFADQIKASRK